MRVPIDADDGGRIIRIEGAPPVVAFVHWERESCEPSWELRGRDLFAYVLVAD
jgi:hypothetical protein